MKIIESVIIMKIDLATMTGADEKIHPNQLLEISEQYPFVEWGILLSQSSEGDLPRYPSRKWVESLLEIKNKVNLSGHICGRWGRDLLLNSEWTIFKERPEYVNIFKRIQFNFNFSKNKVNPDFWEKLKDYDFNYIFQAGGENLQQTKYSLLFDASGGNGITPKTWKKPIKDVYCGYAGGLSPDNIEKELKRIEKVVDDRNIWIDMEAKIRDDKDNFDLEKVKKCLEVAKKYVS